MFHLCAHNHVSANRILVSHPLVLSALIEEIWSRNPAAAASPYNAWPGPMNQRIFNDFAIAPVLPRYVRWEHLIYAYLLEETGIVQIFATIMQKFLTGEELDTPSVATQQFWRNTETLFYQPPVPTTVWQTTGPSRPDETVYRKALYWRMFGLEPGEHANGMANQSYHKDSAANTDFRYTFESLASEAWTGIVNTRNTSGRNDADDAAIATAAASLRDMFQTRRENANLQREEFRAVVLLSWLHLAISFNSPVVADMRATANSPDLRLAKMANRVGMKVHPATRWMLQLALPLSFLFHAFENNLFTSSRTARQLYLNGWWRYNVTEPVVEQYSLAMGRNLKASPVSLLPAQPDPALVPTAMRGRGRALAQVDCSRPIAVIGAAGTR